MTNFQILRLLWSRFPPTLANEAVECCKEIPLKNSSDCGIGQNSSDCGKFWYCCGSDFHPQWLTRLLSVTKKNSSECGIGQILGANFEIALRFPRRLMRLTGAMTRLGRNKAVECFTLFTKWRQISGNFWVWLTKPFSCLFTQDWDKQVSAKVWNLVSKNN